MSKRIAQANPTNPALAEALTNAAVKSHGSENVPARKGKGVPATKDYSTLGIADASTIWKATRVAGETFASTLKHLGQFVKFGWGETTGKKRNFAPQTESYFAGMKKFGADLPATEQSTFATMYANTRRVMGAYLHYSMQTGKPELGVEHMEKLLDGPGTIQQKIGALPTISGQAPKTGGSKRKARTTTAPASELLAAESAQRVTLAAKFTEKDMVDFVGALSNEQLIGLVHIAVSRMKSSTDKVAHEIGEHLAPILESEARSHIPPGSRVVINPNAGQAASA